MKKKSKISIKQRIKTAFNSAKPLLLRHHPLCEKFEGHTFRIKGIDFCIGCFIGYPTATISIITLPFTGLFNILTHTDLLIISIIFLSSFLLSLFGLTKRKSIKIISKISIGVGAGFLFWSIFNSPNPYSVNFIIFGITFIILLSILNAYHGYGTYRICKKCEYKADWNKCPGMSFFNEQGNFKNKNIEEK